MAASGATESQAQTVDATAAIVLYYAYAHREALAAAATGTWNAVVSEVKQRVERWRSKWALLEVAVAL